jgi:hypothetical protein
LLRIAIGSSPPAFVTPIVSRLLGVIWVIHPPLNEASASSRGCLAHRRGARPTRSAPADGAGGARRLERSWSVA